jgi:ADP-ribose pyrophosphatase YjhB (NUDIX family)
MQDMTSYEVPRWLTWAREIQALGQTGYFYAPDDYHRDRYLRLQHIAAEIIAEHSAMQVEKISDFFKPLTGYATPKIDVRGAIFRESRILMVRERVDGKWCMPGGWADVGDIPSAMVEREVREESGLLVRAKKVIGIFDANHDGTPLEVFHAYKIVFLCEDQGGTPVGSPETSESRFFDRADIPELSSDRTCVRHLDEAYAHFSDPARPTHFD